MTVIISEQDLETIRQQGRENYPYECCGLLLGVIDDWEKKVFQVVPVENDWENQRSFLAQIDASDFNRDVRDAFAINPLTFLRIEKEARQNNLNVIGVYHSHPDHCAIPSDFDRAIASSVYSYLIVSLEKGEVKEILSWVLNENHQFMQEEIKSCY